MITTGGGFSTYFAAPSYQTSAVAAYFASLNASQTPTAGYNPQGRAYPDISLIAVNYQVIVTGEVENIFGTSASAPVIAAFVSLANAQRLAQNKSSLGFLNPTLYAVGMNTSIPQQFNDVTLGHNKCCAYSGSTPSAATCCASGFYTTTGWDPVTGWGSVNYTAFAAMFGATAPASSSSSSSTAGALSTPVVAAVAVVAVVIALIAAGVVYCRCANKSFTPVAKTDIPSQSSPDAGATVRRPQKPTRSAKPSKPAADLEEIEIAVASKPPKSPKSSPAAAPKTSPKPSPPPKPSKYRPTRQSEEADANAFDFVNPQRKGQDARDRDRIDML